MSCFGIGLDSVTREHGNDKQMISCRTDSLYYIKRDQRIVVIHALHGILSHSDVKTIFVYVLKMCAELTEICFVV